MSAITNPPVKWTGSVSNGSPETVYPETTLKGATSVLISAYSDRDVTVYVWARKPFATFHTKYPLAITGATQSPDHALVAKNLHGPFMVTVENDDEANPANVEVEVIVEAVG